MRCVFLGHRDCPDSIKAKLRENIINLISEKRASEFYVGNNGRFDFIVQTVLYELAQEGFCVPYRIILSKIDEVAIVGHQDATLFPEELALGVPKFAIYKRNEWLLSHADILISYVVYEASNSGRWLNKARKRGINIINLA